MAGLQSGEGRMMIDSVVWAQHINVTDRHTNSHVTTAIAEHTAFGWQKCTSNISNDGVKMGKLQ